MITVTTRIPIHSNFNSSRFSCPTNFALRILSLNPYFLITEGCACGHKYYYSSIVWAGKTDRELDTSPIFSSGSQSSDDNKSSSDDASGIISGKLASAYVLSAVAFGVGLGFKDGVGKASEFFVGYLLEQSLSVDNLFVFILIFKYFKVPFNYQSRVLSYGIAGAVMFRFMLILLGTATIQRFEAVNIFLAMILLYSSFKLFAEEDEETDLSDNFIVKTCQKVIPVTCNVFSSSSSPSSTRSKSVPLTSNSSITNGSSSPKLADLSLQLSATPLLLTVAVIEPSDIAFAVDSIPAVFGVTWDPFVVITSNFFAILGLRSYFTLISESMADLEYLQPAIGYVLGFIGCKMILDYFGLHIPTEVSLGVVATAEYRCAAEFIEEI